MEWQGRTLTREMQGEDARLLPRELQLLGYDMRSGVLEPVCPRHCRRRLRPESLPRELSIPFRIEREAAQKCSV
jgi:hypothetical protein